jgi:hypothetical protein
MNEPREWVEKVFSEIPDDITEGEIMALAVSLVDTHTDSVPDAFELLLNITAVYAEMRGIPKKVLAMLFMSAAKDIDRMEH